MAEESLSGEERSLLLALARQAIERAACGEPEIPPDLAGLPPRLCEPGVCFVTLTTAEGQLRGCIGALEILHPLALDVCRHAAAAALEDYRFPPVRPEEVPLLHIEISRLTTPCRLDYTHPDDLSGLLRPLIDGVVLHDGLRRATFLPQVWEKIPDPNVFLSQLCLKMGCPDDLWRRKMLVVEVYQVEEFHEE